MPITRTTVEILYTFDELSDEGKQKAVEKLWDLNIDYDWWESTYEDAARIGVKIGGFDIGYRNEISGYVTQSLLDCCKLIRKEHGKSCDTFETAAEYLETYIQAFKEWLPEQDQEDLEHWKNVDWLKEFGYSDEADEVTADFQKTILEDHLFILRREYDYLTGQEAIIESIQANEYMFTEDGALA
jgi:hypothetical protein